MCSLLHYIFFRIITIFILLVTKGVFNNGRGNAIHTSTAVCRRGTLNELARLTEGC